MQCIFFTFKYHFKGQFNLEFSQNANQKLQGFLPYQTNKDRSTFFGECSQFFWLFGRPVGNPYILYLHFGRNDDLINSS